MAQKIVYSFHPDTREYLGTELADESPLEPGVWLIPANATEASPPCDVSSGCRLIFTDRWIIEKAPELDANRTSHQAREDALARLAAHRARVIELCHARERQLMAYLHQLPDSVSAFDAFNPAAAWNQ